MINCRTQTCQVIVQSDKEWMSDNFVPFCGGVLVLSIALLAAAIAYKIYKIELPKRS